ncbi:MAG: hypothetical protein ACRDRW_18100 [Pseudonocardiaceae bacterium]
MCYDRQEGTRMSDSDTQQPTEPPEKATELATARDQAVADGSRDGSGHPDDTRHGSASCQLILSERALSRFELLRQRHRRRAWNGLVLVNSRGECHSFAPERWPTMGELLWKGRGTLYEVDMGLHWTSLKFDLPSHAEAFPFHAVIDIEWRVTNPDRVVKNGMNDVREALSPSLHHRLSAITRQFDVQDTAAAEAKAHKSLTDQPIGGEYGLESHVPSLRMQMDEPTVIYAAAIRQVQREISLERETQALRLLRENSTTTLITRRVERYRDIIVAGDYDQFALQIAQNPDEVATVVQMLRNERLEKYRNFADFVTRLVDSGAIERYEIDDLVKPVLDWFKEAPTNTIRSLEQAAKMPVQHDFGGLPPADTPDSSLPDPPPIHPVRPPGDAPTHGAEKPW